MKVVPLFAIVFAYAVGLAIPQQVEAKDKWVCMKDGEEIKVKGKKPKDKQKKCTEEGGVWEKKAAEEKQESGMGGAW
jgi:hypothetical protein